MKVNHKFSEFITQPLDEDLYLEIGGYGSGKSHSVIQKLVLTLVQEERTALVVRQHYNTLKDSVYSLIKEIIVADFEDYLLSITKSPLHIKFKNGSEILFRGVSDPEKLKSINKVSLVFIEEASEIGLDGYRELLGRLRSREKKNIFFLATNPVSFDNWIYKEFFEKQGINEVDFYTKERIYTEFAGMKIRMNHSTYKDNAMLPEAYKKRLEGFKETDPYLYDVAALGRFGVLGERLFPNHEVIEYDEIPNGLELCGLDLGYSISYNSCVRLYVDDITSTITITDEFYSKGQTSEELASSLREREFSNNVIYTDLAAPQIIRELNVYGINAVKCKKVKGQKMQGLKKVKNYRVKIHSRCKQTISDFKNLCFFKDKDGNIHEDKFNFDSHILDSVIYALSYHEPKQFSVKHNYRDPYAAIKYK